MQIRSLTSLRFFAAAAVVGSHLTTNPGWLHDQLYEGYIGVTFFFVLSGFILSHSYAHRISAGVVSHREFWWARVARVYPLHALMLALMFSVAMAQHNSVPYYVIAAGINATLTQSFFPRPDVYFALNSPAWSLSVEAFFYALFPLLVLARTRTLAGVVAAVVSAHLIAMACGVTDRFAFYIFPPARLADFAMGMLAFRLHQRLGGVTGTTATRLQVFGLGVLVAAFAMKASVPQQLRYDLYYLLPMALVVLAFAFSEGALSRALSGRTLVFLGNASFALYMVHQPIISALRQFNLPPGAAAAAAIGLSLPIACLMYRAVEKPAQRAVLAWGKTPRRLGRAGLSHRRPIQASPLTPSDP